MNVVLEHYWIAVILAFARTFSFINFLPFFRNVNIPMMIKIAVAFGISLLSAKVITVDEINHIWGFFLLILLEMFVGLILAFLVELMFSVVRIAGSIIDLDIGFFNPFTDMNYNQTTALSNVFFLVFLLIFITVGGLENIITGFVFSFGLDISTQLFEGGRLLDFIIETITFMFFGAIQIALPFMMATFLINIGMLLMTKTVDKINVLTNIFGVKILVGLMLIFVSVPTLMIAFQQVNDHLIEKYYEIMNYLFEKRG